LSIAAIIDILGLAISALISGTSPIGPHDFLQKHTPAIANSFRFIILFPASKRLRSIDANYLLKILFGILSFDLKHFC
jgi:hypothetical protein